MLAVYNWNTLASTEKDCLLARPKQVQTISATVANIIQAVRQENDQALLRFTQEFDGLALQTLCLPKSCIENASISNDAMQAILTAIETISTYHEHTLPKNSEVQTAAGVSIQRRYQAIERVGLYVPGGNNAPLVSSLLMQAIPAKIAGCQLRVLCTPANRAGLVDPHLLVAARLCEIDTIYPLGGAQAIAAMAYGTETVSKVDKIFGPGNAFVTEAKVQVANDPEGAAIDLPAGPSEVMVVADAYANPEFIAADLLAQLEHGADSQALCLCEDPSMAKRILQAFQQQLQTLSRASIVKKSATHSAVLVCASKEEQLSIINAYAPEHVIIQRQDAKDWVQDIRSAGTIFLGAWAAETMGDYVSGSNHVLPTNGYAKNHSGLGTQDFLKLISVQSITEEGLRSLGKAAITLANIEGLDAHANAVSKRLSFLEQTSCLS